MNKKTFLRGARAAVSIKASVLSSFRVQPSPLFMVWEATRACNLRCASCYMDAGGAGERSADAEGAGIDSAGGGRPGGIAVLGAEEAKTLIADAARLGLFCLVITGGEPLLREDVFDVRAYASSLGIFVSLTTNGTLIDEANVAEVSKFDHVTISADLAHETSCKGAGPMGRPYESFVEDLLMRLRGRSPKTIINVQTVIDGSNWDRLLDINTKFYDFGIDAVFQLRYENDARIEVERWKTMVRRMRFRSRALGWIQKRSLDLFPAISRGASSAPCLALTSNFVVSPEGQLLPCNFRREKLADLRGGASFAETWRSLRERRKRLSSSERGCSCANTCFLPAAMLLA